MTETKAPLPPKVVLKFKGLQSIGWLGRAPGGLSIEHWRSQGIGQSEWIAEILCSLLFGTSQVRQYVLWDLLGLRLSCPTSPRFYVSSPSVLVPCPVSLWAYESNLWIVPILSHETSVIRSKSGFVCIVFYMATSLCTVSYNFFSNNHNTVLEEYPERPSNYYQLFRDTRSVGKVGSNVNTYGILQFASVTQQHCSTET